jgi:hypothetical protein
VPVRRADSEQVGVRSSSVGGCQFARKIERGAPDCDKRSEPDRPPAAELPILKDPAAS